MNLPGVSLAALFMGCFACSGNPACEGFGNAKPLSSQLPPESFVLSDAGDNARISVRAELSGLPELWQSESAIADGALSLRLGLGYEGDPVGGDGRTEMPRVRATFGLDPLKDPHWAQTEPFTSSPAGPFGLSIFETCLNQGDRYCCEYGARECSLLIEVELERLDGAPLPPLAVEASIEATASVSSCPLGGAPTLTLEREE
jgi:hypothetical protein